MGPSRFRRRGLGPLAFAAAAAVTALAVVVPAFGAAQTAQTFTVTTLSDNGPGSFRAAIAAANANSGTDTITFAITGVSGTPVIAVASPLPHLTGPVVIDGINQQNGKSVEIDGQNQVATGLVDDAGHSTIDTLTVDRFTDAGIVLDSGGGGTVLKDDYVGTDEAFDPGLGNGNGIRILGSSSNQVNSADIDGNAGSGIELLPNGTRLSQANKIQSDGIGERGGNGLGVLIAGSPSNTLNSDRIFQNGAGLLIREFQQGSTVLHATGNLIETTVISDNTGVGAEIRRSDRNRLTGDTLDQNAAQGLWIHGAAGDTADANQVDGNRLGSGAANPNGGNGIGMQVGPGSNGTLVGTAAAGNAIAGNVGDGLVLDGATNTTVEGDNIGKTYSGIDPNGGNGVTITDVDGAASGNTIGGANTSLYNVIVANQGDGILVTGPKATNNKIGGNFVGVLPDGYSRDGNGGAGIEMANSASSDIVGFGDSGQPNTIAYNGGAGVQVDSGTADRILTNSIHDNGGLGIDLLPAGVTPNDPGDADTGPDGLQNFPVLTSATVSNGTATVSGTLNTNPYAFVRIQLFDSDVCDASGYGEGQTYLTYKGLTADSHGNISFTFSGVPVSTSGPPLQFTATATQTAGTSEFSACRTG